MFYYKECCWALCRNVLCDSDEDLTDFIWSFELIMHNFNNDCDIFPLKTRYNPCK